MKNKIQLLSVLMVLLVFASGCADVTYEFDENECPNDYVPVCGQPIAVGDCPPGADCMLALPDPKTYKNFCYLEKDEATLLYEGKCVSDCLENEDNVTKCYAKIAMKNNDYSLCEELGKENLKGWIPNCYAQIAVSKKDKTVCDLINEDTWPSYSNQCYKMVEEEEIIPWIVETVDIKECAKEGETVSDIFEDYPSKCCEGLTKWNSGMDTRISVGDECYSTLMVSGSPTGICIKCGDGICGEFQNVCNCPEDCIGTNNTDYLNVGDFCDSHAGKGTSIERMCLGRGSESELCKLCEWEKT